MRHYAARQREGRDDGTSGRWDYTVRHDDATFRVGYCYGEFDRAWPEQPGVIELTVYGDAEAYQAARARHLEHAAKYHAGGHATREEACACYLAFVLDHEIRYVAGHDDDAEALFRCEAPGCRTHTSGGAVWSGTSRQFDLCQAHRTRETVASLIGSIGESWCS